MIQPRPTTRSFGTLGPSTLRGGHHGVCSQGPLGRHGRRRARDLRRHRLGLGTGHGTAERAGRRRKRRCAARRHRHRNANRHCIHPYCRHRRERRLDDAEHADWTVPARGFARGIPHLRADRHRPAGQRQPGDQHDARSGEPGRDDHGRRRNAARGRPQRRDQRGRRAGADRGVAAPGPPGHRSHRARRRRGQHGPDFGAQHEQQRGDLGGRRAAQRCRVSARRCRAQQPARSRQPAVPLPGRAAGIQRGERRSRRGDRYALVGCGQCRHQVRHQQISRERVRVLPRRPVQRSVVFRPSGRRRREDGRRPQPQPVRRHAGRPDRVEQAVLLRRLRAQPHSANEARQHRVRAHARDDVRRLYSSTPRRRATPAGKSRCVRRS